MAKPLPSDRIGNALMDRRMASLKPAKSDSEPTASDQPAQRPSRIGRKRIYTYVTMANHTRLKVLAAETGTPIDQMIKQALTLWLAGEGSDIDLTE